MSDSRSHEKMIKTLRAIADKSKFQSNPFDNRRRLGWLQSIKNKGFDRGIDHSILIAKEMLRSGYSPHAIDFIESILDTINPNRYDPSYIFTLNDLLAMSYFRLGEEENCLQQHSHDSCIIPIRNSGLHSKKMGAQKAINELNKLLMNFPQNFTYRWLLNIAYMSVGEFPSGVPEQWLIPQLEPQKPTSFPEFTDISILAGLDHISGAGGSAVEDFDQDGLFDIICSSWGLYDQVHFFKNMGNGKFEDHTESSNLIGITGGLNMIQGDYNNDGFPDIFILRTGWLAEEGKHPNSLLRNNGDGTFTDITMVSGLFSEKTTQTASWGDFNNDGWIDLFIGNETQSGNLNMMNMYVGKKKPSNSYKCELFINNQDGTFTDVSEKTGLDVVGFIKGALWLDINNDGWQDLYLSRLGQPNLLFENQGYINDQNVSFKDVSEEAGVSQPMDSFPVLSFDFNNDGWEDIFVSGYRNSSGDVAKDYLGLHHDGETPRLYLNNRDGTFRDITSSSGLNHPLLTMGCNYGDLNNDGFLDIYLGTGDPDFRSIQPNRMYLNHDGKFFEDITLEGRFGHLQKGHGVSFCDFDNDGDQDIFSVLGGAYEGDVYQNILMENPGNFNNNWIGLSLRGTYSNRFAIGARIEVSTPSGDRIYRTVSAGGTFGQSPFDQMIGLGQADKIGSIRIQWPGSSNTQIFQGLEIARWYRIEESNDQVTVLERKQFNFLP